MNVGGVGGAKDLGPIEPDRGPEQAAAPAASQAAPAARAAVFPRSGWEDSGALAAARVRASLGLDSVAGTFRSWRMRFLRTLVALLDRSREMPRFQPVYGMTVPRGPVPIAPPEPPRVQPVYGAPMPRPPISIQPPVAPPEPPRVQPVYGAPMPRPPISVLPPPAPTEPRFFPVYGMTVPGGGAVPAPDPLVQPVYGMRVTRPTDLRIG